MRVFFALFIFLNSLFIPLVFGPPAAPKNVIVIIGDGLGYEHVRSAGYHMHGEEGTLSFEQFPYQAELVTHSKDYPVTTDSAASATAIATGYDVRNFVVSIAPDGTPYETLLEYYQARCKSTGLVTTDELTGATVAAFGAHVHHRRQTGTILNQYVSGTRPNMILGGLPLGFNESAVRDAGYQVARTKDELDRFASGRSAYVLGGFGTGQMAYSYDGAIGATDFYDDKPRLGEMAWVALRALDNDPDGMFLVIENELIDSASHLHQTERTLHEVEEFVHTVDIVLRWMEDNPDTLLVVLSDHETGGMALRDNGRDEDPSVEWLMPGHTNDLVPVYATGPHAEAINGRLTSTQVNEILKARTDPNDAPCADEDRGAPLGEFADTTVDMNSAENSFAIDLSSTDTASRVTLLTVALLAVTAFWWQRRSERV